MRGSNKYIFLISVFLLSGCGVDWFGLAYQKISEDYTIGYIDDPSFRTIRYQNVGQIPPCVFEVGWSDKYIIAKQRFAKSHNEKINYYIIDIEKNKDIPGRIDQKEGVLGPFTESEFVIKSHELELPKDLVFSKVYKGCE